MDLYESNTHSFIVKVWLEEPAEGGHRAIWRGHITHVPSGQRRYIQALEEISAFIGAYLRDLGADLGQRGPQGEG